MSAVTAIMRANRLKRDAERTAQQISGTRYQCDASFKSDLIGAMGAQIESLCHELDSATAAPLRPIDPCLWVRGVEHEGQTYSIAFNRDQWGDIDQYRVYAGPLNVTGLCPDDDGIPDWIVQAIERSTAEQAHMVTTFEFAQRRAA